MKCLGEANSKVKVSTINYNFIKMLQKSSYLCEHPAIVNRVHSFFCNLGSLDF